MLTIGGYALYYFVRKNFSMAMPGLETDLGISKTSLGIFLTLNGIIYGFSRFANGFLADKLNARFHMAIGLALCAAANFSMGFGVDIASWITGAPSGLDFSNALVLFMGITWLVCGVMQGAGYPPCVRLLTHWVPPGNLATKMAIWNTSHSIGAGLVIILCGYIMKHMGAEGTGYGAWRWCFWIPAGIALAGSVVLLVFLRDTPSSVGLPELEGTTVKLKKAVDKSKEYRALLREKVFFNPVIWIISGAKYCVYVVRMSILDWGPMLLQQSKGVSLVNAGWLVALFEVTGIVGMVLAGWATDRYLKGYAHRTCVFCMAGAALFAFVFWQIPSGSPAWMLLAALCGVGFFIYGAQTLITIAVSNQATKKVAASAAGFTGIFGYGSTAVSGIGFGFVAERYGWNSIHIAIVVTALIGMGIFLLIWRAKPHGYEEKA
jgi:OPA family glycerol-3-phosphate transporter-like MFS transporter/OPA family sugar phosphate sensor protein UhpC-like MFS transporter